MLPAVAGLALLVGIAALSGDARAQDSIGAIGHLNTSNSGGVDISSLVGASRFYSAGYTGTRAVVANIEAGHVWNGHETLTGVTTFITGTDASGDFDRHATWVGHTLAGNGAADYQKGIAYGASLWSGAIATSWSGAPYSLDFNISASSYATTYNTALLTGISGRVADVTNSSYGFSDPQGNDPFTVAADGFARQSRRTMVFSAGNSGGAGTVGAPGSGYNSISVGSVGNSSNGYSTVSGFSSRGPLPFQAPDIGGVAQPIIPDARPGVDLVAPGEDLYLAFYGGATGGNTGGTSSLNPSAYSSGVAGTSFSAPIVAGSATLLCDYAYANFAANLDNAINGQVIKAVLMNSADQLAGYDNGQSTNGSGVITTTKVLDSNQGAGRLNLNRAFDQYTSGTTDVAGTGGGTVGAVGWDLGTVAFNGAVDYVIGTNLAAGSTFTATMDWYIERSVAVIPGGFDYDDTSFTNLDLQLFKASGGIATTEVAESVSLYNNAEHFQITIPTDGQYLLRVKSTSMAYGVQANQTFGLAWFGTAQSVVPEPSSLLLLTPGVVFLLALRRRRHSG